MSSQIILVVIFIASLIFVFFNDKKNQKAETDRFKEFVKAVMSKDMEEYSDAVVKDEELPMQAKEDEMIELEDVEPEQLIKAIKDDNQ